MASISWEHVLSIAPELDCISVEAQDLYLDYANTEAFNIGEWGGEESFKLRLARIYMAAHIATIGNRGATGAAGPVVDEKAGDLEREYSDPLGSSSAGYEGLLLTPYGQALRSMFRVLAARAPVVL